MIRFVVACTGGYYQFVIDDPRILNQSHSRKGEKPLKGTSASLRTAILLLRNYVTITKNLKAKVTHEDLEENDNDSCFRSKNYISTLT